MPALSFQKQFVDKIKKGEKTQTIRSKRKNPIKEGDILYLYTGMRTKSCEKIGEVYCDSVINFEILIDGRSFKVGDYYIDSEDSMNKIAVADGFKDWVDMVRWFIDTHGLPFKGDIITW